MTRTGGPGGPRVTEVIGGLRMSRMPRLRQARPLPRTIMWLALAATVAGCGDTPLSTRYAAERDLWNARRLERSLQAQPEPSEALLEQTRDAYARVVEDYPSTVQWADSAEVRNLGRVRASAVLGLSRILRATGEIDEAARVLTEHRLDTPWDLEVTLRLHRDLVEVLSVQSDPDTLIAVLRGLVEVLPPGTPDGEPIPAVLEAPLREVELMAALGREEEARRRMDEVRAYYRSVAALHEGTAIEVAALLQLASAFMRESRFEEAEQVLEQTPVFPAAERFEPQVLFTQATVRQQGLHDYAGAVRVFDRLVRKYPEDPRAPGALLQMGIAFAAAEQPDSALAAFDAVESRYAADIEMCSQARFLGATVLQQQGRSEDALRRYREVSSKYPRTSSGLLAPLQIAAHYQESGDEAARSAVLREASTEYQRIARSLKDDPGSRDLVLNALDHLADVYMRLGEWENAVQAFLTRAEGYPGDYRSPLAYVRAAAIQEEQLRDPAGAIATLEKLTLRYPDLPLSLRAQSKIERLRDES